MLHKPLGLRLVSRLPAGLFISGNVFHHPWSWVHYSNLHRSPKGPKYPNLGCLRSLHLESSFWFLIDILFTWVLGPSGGVSHMARSGVYRDIIGTTMQTNEQQTWAWRVQARVGSGFLFQPCAWAPFGYGEQWSRLHVRTWFLSKVIRNR